MGVSICYLIQIVRKRLYLVIIYFFLNEKYLYPRYFRHISLFLFCGG